MEEQAREKRIMKRLHEHYQELEKRNFEIVAVMLQGSQNYNLDEYSNEYMSDIDSKAIILPSFDDFVRVKSPYSHTIILDNEEHIDTKDIRCMAEMWKKENISYIELLYTDFYIVNPKYAATFDMIRSCRDKIVTSDSRRFVNCLVGMAHEKRKALCHPYPGIIDKIEKYGFDGKQLHHLLRLFFFLNDFINNKPIADCYKITNEEKRNSLMNLKKNLETNGINIMSKESAIYFADALIEAMEHIKLRFIAPPTAQIEIPAIYDILKQRFKEELL